MTPCFTIQNIGLFLLVLAAHLFMPQPTALFPSLLSPKWLGEGGGGAGTPAV